MMIHANRSKINIHKVGYFSTLGHVHYKNLTFLSLVQLIYGSTRIYSVILHTCECYLSYKRLPIHVHFSFWVSSYINGRNISQCFFAVQLVLNESTEALKCSREKTLSGSSDHLLVGRLSIHIVKKYHMCMSIKEVKLFGQCSCIHATSWN